MPFSSDTRSTMMSRITKVYRFVFSWIYVRPSEIVSLIRDKRIYSHATYYPELKEKVKPAWRIFLEQFGQIMKYGRFNRFYFLYGFDTKSKQEQKEYVHSFPFQLRRGDLNLPMYHDYTCILRDKLVFSLFADGIGIKTAQILYYTFNGELFDYQTKKVCSLDSMLSSGKKRFFCKPLDGEEGKDIFILEIKDGQYYIDNEVVGKEKIQSTLMGKRYLIQDFVSQHEEMSRLHPQSVNTIRLVTVRSLKDGVIHILPSIQRIGTGDSTKDNTSKGGVAVGINLDTGYLKQYGFYKPDYGLKIEVHPDSHIVFSEFQIPNFEEVKKQALYFHSMLPQIHSIGWDIAVGPEGPVFIEGNDNWEINGPQACNGGMMKYFKEYFFD